MAWLHTSVIFTWPFIHVKQRLLPGRLKAPAKWIQFKLALWKYCQVISCAFEIKASSGNVQQLLHISMWFLCSIEPSATCTESSYFRAHSYRHTLKISLNCVEAQETENKETTASKYHLLNGAVMQEEASAGSKWGFEVLKYFMHQDFNSPCHFVSQCNEW